MAAEEVGAKLFTEGEAEFIAAFKKANAAMASFDDALLKLIQTEKKQAAQAEAQKMFAGMTQGQKEAYLALKQTEDQLEKIGTAAKDAGEKSSTGFKKFGLSLTDGGQVGGGTRLVVWISHEKGLYAEKPVSLPFSLINLSPV